MANKITGAIGAFVVMMGLSYVWHEIVLSSFYAEVWASIARAEPNMALVASGYVVAALIMAHMYPFGHGGGAPVGEGLRFGALMGVFMWLPANLVLSGAFMEMTPVQGIVDGLWHAVEGGAGGIVIAMMHARGAEAPAAPASTEA